MIKDIKHKYTTLRVAVVHDAETWMQVLKGSFWWLLLRKKKKAEPPRRMWKKAWSSVWAEEDKAEWRGTLLKHMQLAKPESLKSSKKC